MLFFDIGDPCFEHFKFGFAITKAEWLLWILNIAVVKHSCIVCFTTSIPITKVFSVIASIFLFRVLNFIVDTSLFNKIFTNLPVSSPIVLWGIFNFQCLHFELYRKLLWFLIAVGEPLSLYQRRFFTAISIFIYLWCIRMSCKTNESCLLFFRSLPFLY